MLRFKCSYAPTQMLLCSDSNASHTHMLMWYIHICSCGTYTYAPDHIVIMSFSCVNAPDHIGDAPDHICDAHVVHTHMLMLLCSDSCSYAPTQMHHIHICSPSHTHMLPTTSTYVLCLGPFWGSVFG